jgi:MFS family permease
VSIVVFLVVGGTPAGIVGVVAQGVLDMMVTPLFVVAEARIPASHRATAFAFFSGCFMVMQLAGALAAGVLTELVGVQAAFALACAPTVLVGACTWRLLKPQPVPAEQPTRELVALPAAA